MGVDREEIRRAFEQLLHYVQAGESLKTEKERAQADAAIYQLAIAILAAAAGPAIGRVLERARDDRAPDEAGETPGQSHTWRQNPRGINRALAKLLYDLAPALGPFPAIPVAGDLLAALEGDSPVALVRPRLTPGHRDLRMMWRQARVRITLAVYFYAGRTGLTLEEARRFVAPGVGEDAWRAMKRALPIARRNKVHVAGETNDTKARDAALAAADLATGLKDLIKRAIA